MRALYSVGHHSKFIFTTEDGRLFFFCFFLCVCVFFNVFLFIPGRREYPEAGLVIVKFPSGGN